MDEKGNVHKGIGDRPNEPDVLTGSQSDGRAFTDNVDHTCNTLDEQFHRHRKCSVTWTGSEGRTLLGIQCILAKVAANRI